jgi:hypothetical protein
MKHALSRWLALWLLALGAGYAANDVRFSLTLEADERKAGGLNRLTSDEVAVIDALVRRDTISRAGSTSANTTENGDTTFSQRLTADERRIAGLQKLSAEELPKFDTFVNRYQNAKLARTLLAPPTYLARSSRLTPTEARKEREIHGSFSLSYGFGSGGYSEKTGSMILTMEDPARRYSISVGYSESHIKGGNVYRDPFYGDDIYDPFYGRDYLGRDPFYSRDPFYGRGSGSYYGRDPFYDPLRVVPTTPLPDR